MVFPVRLIHKDKIAREIPRTKLQHHISREVRGIGFFNEMKQDMEEKVFGVESKIEIGYLREWRKEENQKIFKGFDHVYRINAKDAEDEDKLELVNELAAKEYERGNVAQAHISQARVRPGVLCVHMLYYKDHLIYEGEILLKGKDENGKAILQERPRYILAH